MPLTVQRRLAAKILKVGASRIWINPTRISEIAAAITREDVRKLILDGSIKVQPEKGISRVRARERHRKKKLGRRRGIGSRKGKKGAKAPTKETWMTLIRALRDRLKELRHKKLIETKTYRRLYKMAKGGAFRSKAHLDVYIKEKGLLTR